MVTLLVRERRMSSHLSQTELSSLSGVPQGIISGIESGNTKNPRIDTVAKLASALGCTVDELLMASDGSCGVRRETAGMVQDVRDWIKEE